MRTLKIMFKYIVKVGQEILCKMGASGAGIGAWAQVLVGLRLAAMAPPPTAIKTEEAQYAKAWLLITLAWRRIRGRPSIDARIVPKKQKPKLRQATLGSLSGEMQKACEDTTGGERKGQGRWEGGGQGKGGSGGNEQS